MSDHPVKDPDKRAPQGRKPSKFWRLPYKKREFVRHFLACDLDEVEAARRSKWAKPEKDGPRLLRLIQVQEAIEEQGKDLNLMSAVGPEEVRRRLSVLARDDAHPSHFKALDSLARIHGLYVDKLTVEVSRAEITAKIDELLAAGSKGEIVEAQYTSSESSNTVPQLVETTS